MDINMGKGSWSNTQQTAFEPDEAFWMIHLNESAHKSPSLDVFVAKAVHYISHPPDTLNREYIILSAS